MSAPRRVLPDEKRRGWCPSLARPMPTGDGLLARVHPPLGVLSLAQARAVAEGARRFGNGHVDVTARGNLQVRGVRAETAAGLAAWLSQAGLGDVRDDGGPQRLTLTSPLAGHDILALARTIEAEGLRIAVLPAKTLVAIVGAGVSGEGADIVVRPGGGPDGCDPQQASARISHSHPHPEVPKRSGGLEGALQEARCSLEVSFEAAGAAPQDEGENGTRYRIDIAAGDCVVMLAGGEDDAVIVSEAEAAGAVGAMLRAFAATGRKRVHDLSADERADVRRAGGRFSIPSLRAKRSNPALVVKRTVSLDCFAEPVIGPAKGRTRRLAMTRLDGGGTAQPSGCPAGLSDHGALTNLAVEAPFGRCTADMLDGLADIAERIAAPDIGTTPARGFLLACGNREAAAAALESLDIAGFITRPDDPLRAVTACPGAPACASGSTPVPGDAAALAHAFAPFAARGLTAHVSGCTKGCAHPAPADLTLVAEHGRYGIVLHGSPQDEPATRLAFEVALERVRKADPAAPLADTFRS